MDRDKERESERAIKRAREREAAGEETVGYTEKANIYINRGSEIERERERETMKTKESHRNILLVP